MINSDKDKAHRRHISWTLHITFLFYVCYHTSLVIRSYNNSYVCHLLFNINVPSTLNCVTPFILHELFTLFPNSWIHGLQFPLQSVDQHPSCHVDPLHYLFKPLYLQVSFSTLVQPSQQRIAINKSMHFNLCSLPFWNLSTPSLPKPLNNYKYGSKCTSVPLFSSDYKSNYAFKTLLQKLITIPRMKCHPEWQALPKLPGQSFRKHQYSQDKSQFAESTNRLHSSLYSVDKYSCRGCVW